ncbi:hypothetical protein D8M04_09690 [Oceanobacillus piezotolerans]|uniref:Membrane protein NfeD2 N-terminal transmembrane domain-containing protein n=1 Tax=Oceanobacillus piezotolerans TaxID=2448030 RepID=A0A498DAS4_9BACI|nr:NfeD family protein [Oceanobacillus piezotolerans]RLL45130.1 hypothetical protein D8M04_09690 [Oceanobacillus piezotolerans]
MYLFGTSIENIYLIILFAAGTLTLFQILFGEMAGGFFETIHLNPVLILAYCIFFSASGYILEQITTISSVWIIIISGISALALSIFLNIFVLIPMASAEGSLGYTEESLKGRVGRIIIPIPKDGFGEIMIDSKSGMISKPACSYENDEIEAGIKVLVINFENGNLYVVPYEESMYDDYL